MKTIMKVYTGFVVVMAMVGRVCADTINIDNIEWTYTIIDDKVTLGGGNASSPAIPTSTAGDIVIPELICGCPVVSVEAHAFQGCSALTSVSIPDSIEIIGEQAFSGCTCLTNICFGSGVKNIGDDVFYHCTSLRDLTIPNSVTNIGRYMVSKCTNLKRLTLPFIGSCRGNIFSDDAVFGHIFARRMDSGLVKTESQYGYNSVVSYLPLSLKEVRITDETVIAKGAFDNCSNIVNVVINDGIHYIGDYAFAHCKALRSLEVPNSVTNIGRCVFADCGALESMTLPFIGSQRGNLGPKNPNADHYFGAPEAVLGYVFGGEECTGMVRRRQSLGWDDNWVTAYFPIGLTSVTITDESVVSYGAFYGLYMLTNVTLNAGIEKIGPYSFRNCSGLRHVRIPDTVYKLENAAFRGSGLETLLIPLSVSNIELGECGHVFEDSTSLNIAYVPRRFNPS